VYTAVYVVFVCAGVCACTAVVSVQKSHVRCVCVHKSYLLCVGVVCVCVCISSAMPCLAQNRCPDDVHQITLEKQVLSCSVN